MSLRGAKRRSNLICDSHAARLCVVPNVTVLAKWSTKQRVYQILSDSPARPPERPGRPPGPSDVVEPYFRPRQHFKAEQIPQVMDILKSRDSWTWVEANRELLKHSLRPAANKINVFLRDLGFRWDRSRQRWFRGEAGQAETEPCGKECEQPS